VRYAKLGKVRFVGNLDVTRIWERALRKAGLPVAYSEGFSPRPRLSFGLALPLGAESIAEYIDVDLQAEAWEQGADVLASVDERLGVALPRGFDVLATGLRAPGDPSLQEGVVASSWTFRLPGVSDSEAGESIDRLLAAGTLIVTRQRKGQERQEDARPCVESLTLDEPTREGGADGGAVLRATLAGRGLRPSELIAACFPDRREELAVRGRTTRTAQWIERDGARRELLPLPAAGAHGQDGQTWTTHRILPEAHHPVMVLDPPS
jgi:radical SAM-linked protein